MRFILRQFLTIPLLLPLLFASACSSPNGLRVDNASVRLPAVNGRPGVAYFTVSGGETGAHLLSVSSPDVMRIELHETVSTGGTMTMKALPAGVVIAANQKVAFEPGGKHAMLFDIKPSITAGNPVALSFAFADGQKIAVTATAAAPDGSTEHSH